MASCSPWKLITCLVSARLIVGLCFLNTGCESMFSISVLSTKCYMRAVTYGILRISAVDGLFAGFFVMSFLTRSCSSGLYCDGMGSGSSCTILKTKPSKLSAWKGYLRVQSSNKITPSAHTSLFEV